MPIGKLDFQPYVNPYVALPTKEYSDLQEQLRGQYDDTAAIYDYLDEASKSMKALDIDEPLKQRILQETQDRIKIAAEKGNYEDLGRIARREAKDFATKYRPVAEELRKVQDYQKSQKELFEKGLIDKTQYELAMNESLGRYKGIEAGDTFRGHTNARKIDIAEKMSKMFDHYNADAQQTNSDYRITENGMLKNIKTGVEQVLTADVYKNLVQYANTDPEINEYLNDLIYLKTYHLSDDEVKNQINDSFTSIYNSSKLKLEDKQKLASQFQQIINASPQEQRAYIQNTLKQNTISQFAQPIAEREGYTKITQDIDMKALPDAILNGMKEKKTWTGETLDSQVYDAADYIPLEIESNSFNMESYLHNIGIKERKVEKLSDGKTKITYLDDKGNVVATENEKGIFGTRSKDVQEAYDLIKSKKYTKLEVLQKMTSKNPELKEIWEKTKNDLKGQKLTSQQIADEVEKRYNSKMKGLATSKETILIPSPTYAQNMQNELFGTITKDGAALGDIVNRNIYDEKTRKMIPFEQWVKENNIDKNKLAHQAKFTGDVLGKRDIGEYSFTYDGKTYYAQGNKEKPAFVQPLRDAYKVVTKNQKQVGTEQKPINFTNLGLPFELKGISLAGTLDENGKFTAGDIFDENAEWISREPVIQLTQSIPATNPYTKQPYKKGDYISWSEIIDMYKTAREHIF